MKRILLSALIGVGLMVMLQLLSVSEAARMPEDYPLVCRGIATFITDSSSCEGCVNAGQAPTKYVGFRFIRGSKPSGKGLAPGECSWLDREMWAGEPDILIQEIEAAGV